MVGIDGGVGRSDHTEVLPEKDCSLLVEPARFHI